MLIEILLVFLLVVISVALGVLVRYSYDQKLENKSMQGRIAGLGQQLRHVKKRSTDE